MAAGDGDGWLRCSQGHRHWGRFGAAGLVAVRPSGGGVPLVLLQHRSPQVHDGGTWAVPGGARDSHEDVVQAAMRECEEEVGLIAADLAVVACLPGADHGTWTYRYAVALVRAGAQPRGRTFETENLRWVPAQGPPGPALHPGLAADWTGLTAVARAVAGRGSGSHGRLLPDVGSGRP